MISATFETSHYLPRRNLQPFRVGEKEIIEHEINLSITLGLQMYDYKPLLCTIKAKMAENAKTKKYILARYEDNTENLERLLSNFRCGVM